ncbi:MAG: GTP-binding protein [Candidatus Heimdallarchaeota archaeon]|nr:MAG: GTP-binding protein [Candidatus Heimdallarchaeota archaeon]
MSSILRRIFKGKETKKYEITIVGLDGAGKTTIVNRLLRSEFIPTTRTLGVNYRTVKYRQIEFNLIDLGGQQIYRNLLWHNALEKASAIVFVLDSADLRLTEASEAFWDSIQYNAEVPVLFIANKIDLGGARAFDLIVRDLDLARAQRSARPVGLFRVSAKTGEHFYDAFDWIADVLAGEESTFKCKVRVTIMIDLDSHQIYTTKFTNVERAILDQLNEGISETMRELTKNPIGMEVITASDLQLVVVKNHPLVTGLIIGYSDSVVRAKLIAERLMKSATPSIEIGQFDSRILLKMMERQWPLDIYKSQHQD